MLPVRGPRSVVLKPVRNLGFRAFLPGRNAWGAPGVNSSGWRCAATNASWRSIRRFYCPTTPPHPAPRSSSRPRRRSSRTWSSPAGSGSICLHKYDMTIITQIYVVPVIIIISICNLFLLIIIVIVIVVIRQKLEGDVHQALARQQASAARLETTQQRSEQLYEELAWVKTTRFNTYTLHIYIYIYIYVM